MNGRKKKKKEGIRRRGEKDVGEKKVMTVVTCERQQRSINDNGEGGGVVGPYLCMVAR